MAITLTTPITVPSTTLNLVAVKSLRLDWRNLNQPVIANFVLQPYAVVEGSNVESPTDPIADSIDDVFSLAASRATAGKPALATAVTAVLAALQEIETEKGKI